jgi:DNA polymerase III subunit chi
MTEVSFHFNAPDKLQYVCRLLRKSSAAGKRAAVVAPPALLGQIDALLWTFSTVDFVSHVRMHGSPAEAENAKAHLSTVLLCERAEQAVHHEVLVNLGHEIAPGFERFDRVIEVVSGQEADRLAARSRWKHYADRGYQIVKHDLAAAATA